MPIKNDSIVAKTQAIGFSPRAFAFRAILVHENNKKSKIGINIIEIGRYKKEHFKNFEML
jgi:hypothetical protein